MTRTLTIGDVRLTPIYDGYRYVDAQALYDKSIDDWRPHAQYVDDQHRLRMDYGGFVLQTPQDVLMVDPGAAPSDALDRGHLFESLARAGVRPQDVNHVLFTHLHLDHVGSAVIAGHAAFPNARYSCDLNDWAFFQAGPEAGLARDIHRRVEVMQLLAPLAGRFEMWSNSHALVPGINVERAPGHTPGSSIFVIASGGARAMLLGDVVHCPVELTDPEWALIQDADLARARVTREQLALELDRGDARDTVVTAGHFPGMVFGRIVRDESKRRWLAG